MPLVRFEKRPVKNEEKSKEAGRPVYDTVTFCELKNPGERDTVVYPVHKMHPPVEVQFPEAWARYQQDESSEGIVGTPLKVWPALEAGEIATLVHSGVKTVEALAALTDANVNQFPGGLEMRKKAQNYLRAAKEAAPLEKLSAEIASRDEEIALLREQVAALAAGQGVEIPKKRRKKAEAEG